MERGEHLPEPCSDALHFGGDRLNPIQNDKFSPTCPTCASKYVSGQHDHLHDTFPFKAGCELCSTTPAVRCKCGEYH